MVGWATRLIQYRVAEAKGFQIQALHEGLDHTDRILSGNIFVQGFGE